MQKIYREIFLNTTKYVLLRNFFMFITGIISIFIVRLLGPQEYGKYFLVWNLISTLGPVVSLGWLNTLTKFVAEKNSIEEKSHIFVQSLMSVVISGTLFIVIFNIVIYIFPQMFPLEIKKISLIFSIFVVFVAFFNIFEGFWRGLGKFNEFVIIDGLRSNIGNLVGLLVILNTGISYQVIIKSNFFISLLFLILLISLVRKYIIPLPKFIKIDKQVKIFCLTFLLGQSIYMLSTNLDVILLRGILKNIQQVGYYTAAIRIPKFIEMMLISQIAIPMLYYFSSKETFQLKQKILSFSSRILGFLFGVFGLICFSSSQYLIPILFGKEYIGSIEIFRYFSLYLLVSGFISVIPHFYVSENKPYIPTIFYFSITVLLYNFMNIFLIPKYEHFALVISYLICFTVYSIVLCVDSLLRFNVRIIKILFYFILLTSISVIIEILSKIFGISLIIFIFSCFIFKVVSREDIFKIFSINKF